MKAKRKIAALLVGLVGLAVLLYPAVSDGLNRVNGSVAIQKLDRQLADTEPETVRRHRQLAEAYNDALTGDLAASEAVSPEYESILDLGNGIMGSLRIPKIDVELPIYHGVEENALSKGVGHMPRTAFPIGGPGNHAVLSGHTGLPGAKLFTDLTELELEDLFFITVLGDTLAYKVDQIKVVLPDQGEDLLPEPGEDYCTLVTCTPYGINSHRLLVRGSRTAVPADNDLHLPEGLTTEGNKNWYGLLGVLVLLAGIVWMRIRKKKKER